MIDRETAIEIARARAEENGWAFAEPLDILERRPWFGRRGGRFEIMTNAGKRGTKARFIIAAESGKILHEGYIPR